jgi:hypothetical protein
MTQEIGQDRAAHEDKFAAARTKSLDDNSSRTGTQSGNRSRGRPLRAEWCLLMQQDRSQTKQAGNHARLLASSTEQENQNTHVEPVQRKICFMSGKRQCTPNLRKSVATGEDTRAARSAGKIAGSSGAKLEAKTAGGYEKSPAGSWGRAPKNQDGRNIVACGSCLDGKTKQ